MSIPTKMPLKKKPRNQSKDATGLLPEPHSRKERDKYQQLYAALSGCFVRGERSVVAVSRTSRGGILHHPLLRPLVGGGRRPLFLR